MKRSKRWTAILLAMLMVFAIPVSAFASSNPYSDVTKKSVGKDAYKAITYVKTHKGYVDVISGKKFYPKKKITRREFLTMLGNFYGDEKVPVSMTDVRKGNKSITAKWACKKMVEVAEYGFGMTITWEGGNQTLTRALASQYLKVFSDFDPAFKPKK